MSILSEHGDNNSAERLLVVEDDYDIAGLIRHALRSDRWQNIEVVGSGQAAFKSISSNPPDVMILDLNLPDVDGCEVCRIVWAEPSGVYGQS